MKRIFHRFWGLFWLIFLIFSYHYARVFCDQRTKEFSIVRIHSDLAYNSAWDIPPLNAEKEKELQKVLSQPFRYLSCGGQCFAFCSADGQYVLKFFRHKFYKPYSYLFKLPLPRFLCTRRQHKLDRIFYKNKRDFTSQKIAFEDLIEETNLLYLHLNKTTSLGRCVHLIDNIGITHHVALDDVEFIVQKKAQMTSEYFDTLMAKQDMEGARRALHALFEIVVKRCEKGVFDEDPCLPHNSGFIEGKPMFIDTGRFVRDPSRQDPAVYRNDLLAISKKLRRWLSATYPQLLPILDETINSFLSKSS